EFDDLFFILPEATYRFIEAQQEEYSDWRNRTHQDRVALFRQLEGQGSLPAVLKEFRDFDEAMRHNLQDFDKVSVDYDRIPFGNGPTEKDIYFERRGSRYYLAARPWVSNRHPRITLLTTETLVGNAWSAIASRARPPLPSVASRARAPEPSEVASRPRV